MQHAGGGADREGEVRAVADLSRDLTSNGVQCEKKTGKGLQSLGKAPEGTPRGKGQEYRRTTKAYRNSRALVPNICTAQHN